MSSARRKPRAKRGTGANPSAPGKVPFPACLQTQCVNRRMCGVSERDNLRLSPARSSRTGLTSPLEGLWRKAARLQRPEGSDERDDAGRRLETSRMLPRSSRNYSNRHHWTNMGMFVQHALRYGWQLAGVPPEGRGGSFALIRSPSLRGFRRASSGSEPRTRNRLEVRRKPFHALPLRRF